LDARYAPPQTLAFQGGPKGEWSAELPGDAKAVPRWIASLIDAVRPEKSVYLYPRDGGWKSGDSQKLFLQSAIFKSCGIAPVGNEVIVASESERDAVEALFFMSLVYGGTVSDDIFLVPDHSKIILYADHHSAIHAEFRDEDFMMKYLIEVSECE
jgi:hypothetical protein